MSTTNNLPQQNENKGRVTYNVAGQDVTLSYQIVRDYLTKGDGQVSDQDLVQFISVCKFNQLNPFLNEAYLVKFGTQPAQMIVSKEAYMKRADACPQYEGFKAGIIIQRDDKILEVEGCFHLDSDKLIGGWCEVYRSDRKFPIIAKVNLSEYDKKQSIWNQKKSTMIAKIAKVQALREAFPAQLGAMYTQEESTPVTDVDFEDVSKSVALEKAEHANQKMIKLDLGASDGDKMSQTPIDRETGEVINKEQVAAGAVKSNAPGF